MSSDCKMPRIVVFYCGNHSLYKLEENHKIPEDNWLRKIKDWLWIQPVILINILELIFSSLK